MKVHIGGAQIEQVTLMELEVDNVYGPVGTVSWLMRTLREEGNGEDATVGKGTVLICFNARWIVPRPTQHRGASRVSRPDHDLCGQRAVVRILICKS